MPVMSDTSIFVIFGKQSNMGFKYKIVDSWLHFGTEVLHFIQSLFYDAIYVQGIYFIATERLLQLGMFAVTQIVSAIAYCHQLRVVHRDLKPENVVFFNKSDTVKLTDFGFSNLFIPGHKLNTSCGSLAYSAPEILLGDSYDAPAVGVYACVCLLQLNT